MAFGRRSCSAAGPRRIASVSSLITLVALTLLVSAVSASAADNTTVRQTRYRVYFEPGLCPIDVAEQVDCPSSLPICCVESNAVRCCESNTPCDACTRDVVGYQMARGSVMIGVMSLVMVLLIGTMVTSGLGRHLAWSLERHRVIRAYRERLQLRRTAAKRFRDELAATEVRDLPDAVACTICCARRMDCALAPCGHVCSCHFCAKRLKECPVCRVAVAQCYDLPDYLVARLVGQVDEDGGATRAGDEHAEPGLEEMRDVSAARGVERDDDDERMMPGLLSTAGAADDGADTPTKKAAAAEDRPAPKRATNTKKWHRHAYERTDSRGEPETLTAPQAGQQSAVDSIRAAQTVGDVCVSSQVDSEEEEDTRRRDETRFTHRHTHH